MLRSILVAGVGSVALACSAAPPPETVSSALVREEDAAVDVDASPEHVPRAPVDECEHNRPESGARCVTRGACHYAVQGEEWGNVTLVACTCDDEAWACSPVRR